MAGWIKMPLGMEVGLGPGHIVLDGNPAFHPKKGTAPAPGDIMLDGDPAPRKRGTGPNFMPMSVVAKWLDGLRFHLVWR